MSAVGRAELAYAKLYCGCCAKFATGVCCGRRLPSSITWNWSPGWTQCPAVRTRSRAIAVPVQTLPCAPTTATTWLAICGLPGVAPPTMAEADVANRTDERTNAVRRIQTADPR